MAPMVTDRTSTEKKIEDIAKHTERDFERLEVMFPTRLDQSVLYASQQNEFESTKSPKVAVTIDDLPNEVIRQILGCVKPTSTYVRDDHISFYNTLKVCRRWRIIGVGLLYGQSTRDWSPKKWSMINKVVKHVEARMVKLQLDFSMLSRPPVETDVPAKASK